MRFRFLSVVYPGTPCPNPFRQESASFGRIPGQDPGRQPGFTSPDPNTSQTFLMRKHENSYKICKKNWPDLLLSCRTNYSLPKKYFLTGLLQAHM